MSANPKISPSVIQQWLLERIGINEVEQRLVSLGHDDVSIAAHVQEFKKVKYARRQNAGFIYVAIGAFLGFISCVVNMINPIPEWNDFFLYGLTSLAIVIVFTGLFYIFE